MALALRHDHVGITLSRDHLEATISWYAEKLDSGSLLPGCTRVRPTAIASEPGPFLTWQIRVVAGSECLRPVGGGGDDRLAGEDLLDEEAVHLGVGIAAGVGEDGEAVVEVGRQAHGGEPDAAGGDAGEHEGVGAEAAQQQSLPSAVLCSVMSTSHSSFGPSAANTCRVLPSSPGTAQKSS